MLFFTVPSAKRNAEGGQTDHSTVRARASRRSGHAVVEVGLFAPWLFFLLAGGLDFGFFGYAFICAENATRVAAMHTSASTLTANDAAGACRYVLAEMNALPNVRSLTNCSSSPLTVSVASVAGSNGATNTKVTVQYQTVPLIPFPGVPKQLNITRTVEMRIQDY
jgi:hypothetical protein